ncbi:MAG: helix-hairpin-helix domain-containing protein, partial [Gammaproteobacteria bacterium]
MLGLSVNKAMHMDAIVNRQVARKLDEAAELLARQGANPFRISAYRKAADTIERLDQDVRDIFEQGGLEALIELPTVGKGIAAAIREIVTTGRWNQLDRLRGTVEPETLLQTVPGVGPALASRIHDELHIDTLEQLEAAAWDGRLEAMSGVGERKLQALRATLASMLRQGRPRADAAAADGPGVGLLLQVDREYRRGAEAGKLPTIAPKRFNPAGEAWLPILHSEHQGWHFTALYSNTARAHELDRVRDWVVIYFYDDSHEEGQHTVVTETRGPLTGRRVVRGRETECLGLYRRA